MSDFNPMALFFILYESMNVWLWVSLGLALVLVVGIVASALRLYRVGRSMARPIVAALTAGLIAAAVATFLVPVWTLADIGALSAAVDYAFAFLFALVPGAVIAALVFMLAARRCTKRNAATSSHRI